MTGPFHDGPAPDWDASVVLGAVAVERRAVSKARYWAITRDELTELAERAGFGYVEWLRHAYCPPPTVAPIG